MPRLYAYVGPTALARNATCDTPRLLVHEIPPLVTWLKPLADEGDEVTVTFVVLPDGLWIADRHSEHVACARGGPVLSAGEMTFSVDPSNSLVEVVYVTNQSTGFCPEPASWCSVEAALDAAGIAHPGGFSAEVLFRRCPRCAATNVVKDGWFECALCGADLPTTWNYDRPLIPE